MCHDISGFSQSGEEIAYARFSMRNYNAVILYSLLDANTFYAGVSGCGRSTNFTSQQLERALNGYHRLFPGDDSQSEGTLLGWDKKQILSFIENCLATAQKEGNVKIYFG